TERPCQNQQGGRKWPVVVMNIDQRRVKRGKIRSPLEVGSFKSSEGCVDAESAEYHDYGNYLNPPSITLRRALNVGLPKRSHSSGNQRGGDDATQPGFCYFMTSALQADVSVLAKNRNRQRKVRTMSGKTPALCAPFGRHVRLATRFAHLSRNLPG